MALILSIDTALETAGVCLSANGNVIEQELSRVQMEHAGWIHNAINGLFNRSGFNIRDIDCVAVCSGPGSYTGLRVSMATAKGICYTLGVPLVTETSLRLIAYSVKKDLKSVYPLPVRIAPMIDARRMEVFAAMYDGHMHETMAPSAMMLDQTSFDDELERYNVVFCGNGSFKWQNICNHPNAVFTATTFLISDLAAIAEHKFRNKEFSDLAYTDPLYVKSVYTGSK